MQGLLRVVRNSGSVSRPPSRLYAWPTFRAAAVGRACWWAASCLSIRTTTQREVGANQRRHIQPQRGPKVRCLWDYSDVQSQGPARPANGLGRLVPRRRRFRRSKVRTSAFACDRVRPGSPPSAGFPNRRSHHLRPKQSSIAKKLGGGGERCHWQHFMTEARLSPLWACFLDIASSHGVKGVYIGVTQSPVWRRSKCQGYNNMLSHSEYYDAMFVLTFDRGKTILDLETELIQHAFDNRGALAGCKLDNRIGGGTGTVRLAWALALYVVARKW